MFIFTGSDLICIKGGGEWCVHVGRCVCARAFGVKTRRFCLCLPPTILWHVGLFAQLLFKSSLPFFPAPFHGVVGSAWIFLQKETCVSGSALKTKMKKKVHSFD